MSTFLLTFEYKVRTTEIRANIFFVSLELQLLSSL